MRRRRTEESGWRGREEGSGYARLDGGEISLPPTLSVHRTATRLRVSCLQDGETHPHRAEALRLVWPSIIGSTRSGGGATLGGRGKHDPEARSGQEKGTHWFLLLGVRW